MAHVSFPESIKNDPLFDYLDELLPVNPLIVVCNTTVLPAISASAKRVRSRRQLPDPSGASVRAHGACSRPVKRAMTRLPPTAGSLAAAPWSSGLFIQVRFLAARRVANAVFQCVQQDGR
jgi:hypothetical protein